MVISDLITLNKNTILWNNWLIKTYEFTFSLIGIKDLAIVYVVKRFGTNL